MACFLVMHKPIETYTQEVGIAAAKKLLAGLPPDVQWKMSWMIPADTTMLCHWDAPSIDAVRAALEESGITQLLPIVQVREAFEIEPQWYAAQ